MAFVVRRVAQGIGMASEAYQDHQEQKRRKSQDPPTENSTVRQGTPSNSAGPSRSGESSKALSQDDDGIPAFDEWELDEAQDEIAKPKAISSQDSAKGDMSQLADRFSRAHPPPQLPPGSDYEALDCVVVLPQRRPKNRSRGFIRAYPPILEERGIDQDAFLDFIETFNMATQADPWLNSLNLAALAGHALGPGVGIAIERAVDLAVDTAKEAQARSRTNDFLTKINHDYFQPRGLYAMVMSWQPQNRGFSTRVDLSATAQTDMNQQPGLGQKFQGASGTSHGQMDFGDVAPLVFPHLDQVANSDSPEKGSMFSRGSSFVSGYMDRQAQAKYAMAHPGNDLATLNAKPQFKSRYADPTHPAARGSLVGLLTGGAVTLGDGRRARRQYRKENGGPRLGRHARREARRQGDSDRRGFVGGTTVETPDPSRPAPEGTYNGQYAAGAYGGPSNAQAVQNQTQGRRARRRERRGGRERRGVRPLSAIRMMSGKQILYLAIVDLPDPEQMEEARKIMEKLDPEHADAYRQVDVDAPTNAYAYSSDDYEDDLEDSQAYAREYEEEYGHPPPHGKSTHQADAPPSYEQATHLRTSQS